MSGNSWDVIIFTKDNSCEYVPSSWASNKSKSKYLWPKKLKLSELRSAINNCEKPKCQVQYEEFHANCKATVYSLEEARSQTELLLAGDCTSSSSTLTANDSSGSSHHSDDEIVNASQKTRIVTESELSHFFNIFI